MMNYKINSKVIIGITIFIFNIYLAILIYNAIQLKFNKSIQWARSARENGGYSYKLKKYIRSKNNLLKLISNFNCMQQAKSKMSRAGITQKYFYVLYFIINKVTPIIFIIVSIFHKNHKGILAALFLKFVVELSVSMNIKKHESAFKKSAYRIYKFLNNQISSGVRHTDAIKSVYKTVDDKVLRKNLQLMAATYISTNNIDLALKYITDYYKTQEAQSLAIAIKQGIETGSSSATLERKEKNMFSKYMSYIKAETDAMKIKSTFIGILYCLIIIILLSYPLILNMLEAQDKIFIY